MEAYNYLGTWYLVSSENCVSALNELTREMITLLPHALMLSIEDFVMCDNLQK